MSDFNIFTQAERHKIYQLKQKISSYVTFSKIHSATTVVSSKEHCVIAGSCFASWFHDEHPNDIDIFVLGLTGPKIFQDCKDHFLTTYVDDYKSGDCDIPNGRFTLNMSNDQYKSKAEIIATVTDGVTKRQYIFTKAKTRKELLKRFDYVHCCASYESDTFYISRNVYNAIEQKKLVVNCPNSYRDYREKKFLERGFRK